MKEPTNAELFHMVSVGDTTEFWNYINEVLINNERIRVVESHLYKSFSFSSTPGMSYYVAVFKPKGNELLYSEPLIYFLEREHIIVTDYGSSSNEFINAKYEIDDTGTEFNFNMMYPEIGISFSELNVLLKFAQRIKCSFFITTEIK